MVDATVGIKVDVTMSSSQPECFADKKKNLVIDVRYRDLDTCNETLSTGHLLIHNSVVTTQKLTVHVSVKHVHKHGVRGVQPLVRCGAGEHGPGWVQT